MYTGLYYPQLKSTNFAVGRAPLTAQALKTIGYPPLSQLEKWRNKPETHEELGLGLKKPQQSETQLRAKMDKLEQRIERR